MSGKQIGMVAAAGSATLLLAAFAFQALGYAPCAMCLWQRYPHGVAIGVGLLLLIGLPVLPLLVVGAWSATLAGFWLIACVQELRRRRTQALVSAS